MSISPVGDRPVTIAAGPVEAGAVEITGQFAGQGVECPQFRLSTGERISLSGDMPAGALSDGKDVWTLTGAWMDISTCMQGRTFRVSRFHKTVSNDN